MIQYLNRLSTVQRFIQLSVFMFLIFHPFVILCDIFVGMFHIMKRKFKQ